MIQYLRLVFMFERIIWWNNNVPIIRTMVWVVVIIRIGRVFFTTYHRERHFGLLHWTLSQKKHACHYSLYSFVTFTNVGRFQIFFTVILFMKLATKLTHYFSLHFVTTLYLAKFKIYSLTIFSYSFYKNCHVRLRLTRLNLLKIILWGSL